MQFVAACEAYAINAGGSFLTRPETDWFSQMFATLPAGHQHLLHYKAPDTGSLRKWQWNNLLAPGSDYTITMVHAMNDHHLATATVIHNPSGQTKQALLLPVEIKVSSANSPTGSAPKYTVTPEIPKKGNADNLFSVWPEEDFTVKVKLPESFQSPPNLIKWNVPGENIPDNAKEHTFNWTAVGTKRIEVQVGESKFEIWVDVPHVGDVGQVQAIATMPLWATAQIGSWAVFAQDYCNTHYPVSPKRDAIRHSYWCALSVSDGYVTQDQILYFATAHEFDNKWNDTPRQQAFNSTMDLWNNFTGSTVDISIPTLPPTPNVSQILQVLEQKYSAGELWIYDGSTSQGASEGILLKSNGTKIHPVN